jgi:hypothetical protein
MSCDKIKSKDIELEPIHQLIMLHMMLEQKALKLETQDEHGRDATKVMAKREYLWRLESAWHHLLKGWPDEIQNVAHLKGR